MDAAVVVVAAIVVVVVGSGCGVHVVTGVIFVV